ncbi:RNA polymerase III C11 subunit [Tulasnella sp. JGI-2019a]|nr:RNA polymerase III C11 subunit [Tulasnella sp. JGI-2019a]
MLFCPSCANMLIISAEGGANKWACQTCPYEFPIEKLMVSRTKLQRKAVDDVLGGDAMWADADKTKGLSWPHRTLLLTLTLPSSGSQWRVPNAKTTGHTLCNSRSGRLMSP